MEVQVILQLDAPLLRGCLLPGRAGRRWVVPEKADGEKWGVGYYSRDWPGLYPDLFPPVH